MKHAELVGQAILFRLSSPDTLWDVQLVPLFVVVSMTPELPLEG